MSSTEPNDSELQHLLMSTLSDWFHRTEPSQTEVDTAIRTVWMGDYCKRCRDEGPPLNFVRFPSSIKEQEGQMVEAIYQCYLCGTRWSCWWSQEMLNEPQ